MKKKFEKAALSGVLYRGYKMEREDFEEWLSQTNEKLEHKTLEQVAAFTNGACMSYEYIEKMAMINEHKKTNGNS